MDYHHWEERLDEAIRTEFSAKIRFLIELLRIKQQQQQSNGNMH